MPFDHLSVRVAGSTSVEALSVDQAAQRVAALRDSGRIFSVQAKRLSDGQCTYLVITMGVEFTSIITLLDIDVRLLEVSRVQSVTGSYEHLNATERAGGDDSGAVPGLSAPCNSLRLFIPDQRVGIGGTPDAEV